MLDTPSIGRRLFLAASLLVIVPGAAEAQSLTNPLTPDQVACDELQLERLAARSAVSQYPLDPAQPDLPPNPLLILWRSSAGGGFYGGLAVSNGLEQDSAGHLTRDEAQLAFDLIVRRQGDLLSPQEPLRPQATLARRGRGSTLATPAEGGLFLNVGVAVTLDESDHDVPILTYMDINNLAAPGPAQWQVVRAVDDSTGRSIVDNQLADTCHGQLTAFDQKIFAILARTLRVSHCLSVAGCGGFSDLAWFEITLFRGADPHTFRANVYPFGRVCIFLGTLCETGPAGKLALELSIDWDREGKLTTGQVTVLPPCPGSSVAPGCSFLLPFPAQTAFAIYLLPPIFAGVEHQGMDAFAVGLHLDFERARDPHNILRGPVNWRALLAKTTWN
jgi:hypothetical protein